MTREELFEQAYSQHKSKLMRLALGYVKGNKAQAQDLVQDIFIKVWNNLDSFRGDSNPGTWIFRIAVNTCLMFLRSKKSIPFHSDELPDTMEKNEYSEHRFQEMYKCINKLDEENRSIILLELQDVPQEEIAEILGMTHAAVRTRIHRIKDKLSKCVQDE
jgi:RNA polymerase sigma-70 factor (ECF subfamily)